MKLSNLLVSVLEPRTNANVVVVPYYARVVSTRFKVAARDIEKIVFSEICDLPGEVVARIARAVRIAVAKTEDVYFSKANLEEAFSSEEMSLKIEKLIEKEQYAEIEKFVEEQKRALEEERLRERVEEGRLFS